MEMLEFFVDNAGGAFEDMTIEQRKRGRGMTLSWLLGFGLQRHRDAGVVRPSKG